MSHTGTYVMRDGVSVKISDRVPLLVKDPAAEQRRDDARAAGRLLAGYRDLERRGKLGPAGPKSLKPAQILNALKS
jgi:hypothetical protein